jgi:hypothetical protein
MPQEIPAGDETTVPIPVPDKVTDSVTGCVLPVGLLLLRVVEPPPPLHPAMLKSANNAETNKFRTNLDPNIRLINMVSSLRNIINMRKAKKAF